MRTQVNNKTARLPQSVVPVIHWQSVVPVIHSHQVININAYLTPARAVSSQVIKTRSQYALSLIT